MTTVTVTGVSVTWLLLRRCGCWVAANERQKQPYCSRSASLLACWPLWRAKPTRWRYPQCIRSCSLHMQNPGSCVQKASRIEMECCAKLAAAGICLTVMLHKSEVMLRDTYAMSWWSCSWGTQVCQATGLQHSTFLYDSPTCYLRIACN